MYALNFREILSVTMILFAIIDILGAIPVIIEKKKAKLYLKHKNSIAKHIS